ncbi:hypothetical protein ZOSMA_116G00350 [Zostera marina]|uniref:Co-chaperone HscB C-terminal oligomerisation domain-containing protein n=1 Tax=Zostera marina TaxID=29655 RepID=A0A0K9Q476_ZOSMR|nr:hypothetical protein ZOSMA_116G00350 [Zostera marina]
MMSQSREKVWSQGIAALRWRKSLQSHLSSLKHSSKITSTITNSTTATKCYRLCINRRAPLSFYYLQCNYSSKSLPDDLKCRCWNCNQSKSTSLDPFLSCPSCKAVQPIDTSIDYFVIFGIEKKYAIKDGNLDGKYKDWQKKLHPDLVHTKSQKERGYAAEQSALVIEAHRTLSHPISRALYMLQLEGIDVDEEETLSDPELITEIMEIREAVEEAKESNVLNEIKSKIQSKLENWTNSFAKALNNRNFEDAKNSIRRMKYYEKAIQEVVKKL